MSLRHGLVRWTFVVAGAAGMMLGAQNSARAQAWGMQQLFEPPVTSEDIGELVDLVDADEAQEEMIRDLFQGLMQQHDTAVEKLREILKAVSEEAQSDPTVWQDFQRKAIEYMKYQDGLKSSLFEDIRLVLSTGQIEKWPSFERFHRRQHLLDDDQTIVTAARVDLVRVMEDVAEEEEHSEVPAGVVDIVERYEIELDRLLIEKKGLSDKQLEEVLEVMEAGANMMAEMPRWEQMFNESRELQVKIRDVNEKYVRQFAARLEAEVRAEFRKEYNRRAMPTVYERNYLDNAFEHARGIESLTAEQREQLEALEQQHEREAQGIREKWAEALSLWQTEVQMMQMWGGSKSGGSEATAQRDAKQELDERYYELLRSVLNEEQRAALPERESDWRQAGGFGFGD